MDTISAIVIFHPEGDRLLLRKRAKAPYKGLLDFISTHCHEGEKPLDCACRALREAGLREKDFRIEHVMDFAYQTTQWCVQVFQGMPLDEELPTDAEGALRWVDVGRIATEQDAFAGEGYMEHVLGHMSMQRGEGTEE